MSPRFAAAALVAVSGTAFAQTMPMNMPGMTMPATPNAPSAKPAVRNTKPATAMSIPMPAQTGHAMAAALGSYPAQRESSGTAWQPDSSTPMSGPMAMSGGWMLMAHGTLNLVYDHQSGPRGGDELFASGMLMNVLSSMHLSEPSEPWAQRLLEGCGKDS